MVTGPNMPVNVERTGTNGSDNWALKELSTEISIKTCRIEICKIVDID